MNPMPIAALALALAVAALLATPLAAWFVLRRADARLGTLQAQFTRLLEAQQAIDARLEALTALVRDERALTALPVAAPGRAYELAAHLASSGVGTEQLVAQCGLTPAEAELAVRIHGLRSQTRAA